jgi:hypothetical protein
MPLGPNWADTATLVMPGLVPGIHVFLRKREDVDGRDEARP